jgi:hypothetical protein
MLKIIIFVIIGSLNFYTYVSTYHEWLAEFSKIDLPLIPKYFSARKNALKYTAHRGWGAFWDHELIFCQEYGL